MNNFWWKVLAMVLAAVIWLMIVNIEDPQISRTFNDVPVSKLNIEAIESEKMAIEYREGETISVKVRGVRSAVDSMTVEDIYAYADLEKKSITDAVDIVVEVPDNISVLNKEPSMMMVDLEHIITVQKEVQPYMEGEPKEGYIYLDPIVLPNYIEVEGPESKINLIKSVLVPVNIEGVTRDVTLYRSPQIIDASNNLISGLTESVNQIQVQVPIQKTKIVELKLDLDETVDEGYQLLGLTLSQNSLSVRGQESDIDNLDAITISGINLAGLHADTAININVSTILPDGINIYKDEEQILLYADIEPIEQKSIEISHSNINVMHIEEGLQFNFVDDKVYNITYSGIADNLASLDIDSIAPSISLRGLDEGLYDIQLAVNKPLGLEIVTEIPVVTVELTPIPEGDNPQSQGLEGGQDGSSVNNSQSTNNSGADGN